MTAVANITNSIIDSCLKREALQIIRYSTRKLDEYVEINRPFCFLSTAKQVMSRSCDLAKCSSTCGVLRLLSRLSA